MGFVCEAWVHEAPDKEDDSSGKQAIVKHIWRKYKKRYGSKKLPYRFLSTIKSMTSKRRVCLFRQILYSRRP